MGITVADDMSISRVYVALDTSGLEGPPTPRYHIADN